VTEADARYQEENRAMLDHYEAVEVTVLRDAGTGNVISAVAEFANGVKDVLYHISPSAVRPKSVHIITTRRTELDPRTGPKPEGER
jgi:hypothetical protein